MDIHGYPWISVDVHGHPLISMDDHGHPWISIDTQGYLWISMDINGYPLISIDIYDIHGHPWHHFGATGAHQGSFWGQSRWFKWPRAVSRIPQIIEMRSFVCLLFVPP